MTMLTIKLNNGVEMPALGFGVFQTPPDETAIAVEEALRIGYRHIDTAASYANERGVGEAIGRSGLAATRCPSRPRSGSTTTATTRRCTASTRAPASWGSSRSTCCCCTSRSPSAFDRTLEAYRALERLLADGKVRAIGVSNFMPEHLERLLGKVKVVPAANQIEVHPYFQQKDLQRLNARHGILTQTWSPIGGITFYRGNNKSTLEDAALLDIGRKHGKSAAQVMLRWHLQEGRSVIPKSTKPARMDENFAVLDFELSASEIAAIDALDTGVRSGPDPDKITLETFSRVIPEA
jgi:2,5-diketo-D-gluconate reductase A